MKNFLSTFAQNLASTIWIFFEQKFLFLRSNLINFWVEILLGLFFNFLVCFSRKSNFLTSILHQHRSFLVNIIKFFPFFIFFILKLYCWMPNFILVKNKTLKVLSYIDNGLVFMPIFHSSLSKVVESFNPNSPSNLSFSVNSFRSLLIWALWLN